MSGFLLGHELDQITVFRRKASGDEILLRKASETIMKQVQFDPFCVESESLTELAKSFDK